VYTVFVPCSTLPLVPTPQGEHVLPSCSLTLKKKKKWHFCLFKITTQGVSLWYFHVYMCYNPIGSSPLFFLFLPLDLNFEQCWNCWFGDTGRWTKCVWH
jgi:hypothetical protein